MPIKGANATSVFEQDLNSEEIEKYGFPGVDTLICTVCVDIITKARKEISKETSRVTFELIGIRLNNL